MKAIRAPFLDYWHLTSRNSFYTTLKKKKKKSSTRTRSHDRLIISTPLASSRYDRSIFLTEIQYLFARLLLVGKFLRILLLLSYKRKGKAGRMSAPRRIASAMPLQSLPGSMCSSTAASGPLLHKRTISSSSSSFIIFFFTASCGGFVSTSVFVIRRDFRPRQTRILGKDTTIEVLLLSSSFFF